MNTPPLLLAAAALLWALQSGHWIAALAAALAIEAPRRIDMRWALLPGHFNRIADYSLLGFAGIALYFYVTAGMPRAVVLAFEWLPFFALPLALAEAFGRVAELDLSVVVPPLRRHPTPRPYSFNLGYPYLLIWVLGASAASTSGPWFYPGVVALGAWALVASRPRAFPLAAALGMVALAAGLGYAGQFALHDTQLWLESAASDWLGGGGTRTNPYRGATDIGSVGQLKESQEIVLRVRTDRALASPLLLHRATYDGYAGTAWIARNGRFDAVPADAGGGWRLGEQPGARSLEVFESARSGDPVLSLPAAASRVELPEARALKRNPLGTVQASMEPGDASYRVRFAEGVGARVGAPVEADSVVPFGERKAIETLSRSLGLAGLPPAQAIARVHEYFERNFSYSTMLQPPPTGTTPLADFLERTHAGHCEYFATATTLLLRAAGVPARYATGFSLSEFSSIEDSYVARQRHAHAWTRAWTDGEWRDVDNTPPAWIALEQAEAPFWTPVLDWAAWARFRVSRAMAAASIAQRYGAAAILVLVFAAPFAWRAIRRGRGKRAAAVPATAPVARLGMDSEFFAIERRIAELGWPRAVSEPVSEWLRRIGAERDWDVGLLREAAALHSRHRFDPAGLRPDERDRLRQVAHAWLERFRTT